jgi:phosphatidylglycerol lysyltransferase
MQQSRTTMILTRLIAFLVMAYGLEIIASTLLRQVHGMRNGHDIDAFTLSLPLLFGVSYTYLGSLLLRRKYNAWVMAIVLSALTLCINIFQVFHAPDGQPELVSVVRIALPGLFLVLLTVCKSNFRVRSDIRSFQQAVRISSLLLLVAFMYGVGGFLLLDTHDLRKEIKLPEAIHQTIDQFGLTTELVVPHSRRARLILDSLPVISISAVGYAVISFFQPLRMRLVNQEQQRKHAETLLRQYPGDIDDFFKLWPHDKHYYFDAQEQAGLAYHVTRGIALVVGDPFGNPKHFPQLVSGFNELCFVNDWQASFIHVSVKNADMYVNAGFSMQKIGEEAVVDLRAFTTEMNNKYFRQIRNRFDKLGYSFEVLQPPHNSVILQKLHVISDDWLRRPGRGERRLLLGYFEPAYIQLCPVAVVKDENMQIMGFMNLVPTYLPSTVNFDLLRHATDAPGNCNDYLVLGLIEHLLTQGATVLNLGLCPLSGLDEKAEDATLIDSALRFVYANGDRFYSFNGLRRFKAKYKPSWEDRYIAHAGGIRSFTRTLAALNRAMRVK